MIDPNQIQLSVRIDRDIHQKLEHKQAEFERANKLKLSKNQFIQMVIEKGLDTI